MKSSIAYWHKTLSIWIPLSILLALLSNIISVNLFSVLLIASLLIYPLFTACLARIYLKESREEQEAKMLILINSVLATILFYFAILLSGSDIGNSVRNLSVDLHLLFLISLFIHLWAYAVRYALLSRLSYSDFLPMVKKMRFPLLIALTWVVEGFLYHFMQRLIPMRLIFHKRSVRFARSALHAQSLEISFARIAVFVAVYLLIVWLDRVYTKQDSLNHVQDEDGLYKLGE